MTATFWAYALPCLLLPWLAVTAYREWQRWRVTNERSIRRQR